MPATATIVVLGKTQEETTKKQESLNYLAQNATVLELERLAELAKSPKARKMLNQNWFMLKAYV
tara:strand:+ start:34 stop:225 length:192 start_codon:yes stop_codon:yes gene_type:complete